MKTTLERFEAKYLGEPNSGCWLWLGATGGSKTHAYGVFSRAKGRLECAHRVSYELYKGAIHDGLVIDHLCRNTLCVNPRHLEAVTPSVNTLRGANRKREQTHCVRGGHPLSGDNLYLKPNGRRECRICRADQFRDYKEANPGYWRRAA